MSRIGYRTLCLAVAPLVLLPAIMLAVNLAMNPPGELLRHSKPTPPQGAYCSWYCHNHGCHHPSGLTKIFGNVTGRAVSAYLSAGYRFARTHGVGHGDYFPIYVAANLLVYVLVWPMLMYGLYVIEVVQRARIRELWSATRKEANRG